MKFETVNIFKKNINNSIVYELSNEELAKLKETLLSILSDFDKTCKKYNISYMLAGGSALGAIRHNGFIPWDDDIDINMTRREYERFRKAFPKELSEKYWFHNPDDRPDIGRGSAMLRLKGTTLKTRDDMNNDECGIFIDIFIIENTYNGFLMRYAHGFLSLMFGFLLSCRNFYENKDLYIMLIKNNCVCKTKIFIGHLLSWIPISKMTTIWNNINKMCKNNNSKYVTVPVGRKHFFGELYERLGFCTTVNARFETLDSYICLDYDKYLTRMYGDYLIIPNDEDKEKHVILEYSNKQR